MKKFLSLLVVCVLFLSALPFSVLAEDAVVLEKGMKGDKVIEIKHRLYALQYYETNNQFSDECNNAMVKVIKRFQEENGLKETGILTQSQYDLMYTDKVVNKNGVVWNSINNVAESSNYTFLVDEQFTVSSKENVIVLVLDYFARSYLNTMLKKYPDALDMFPDFTYYDNCDSTYVGTYPSITHMVTGHPYSNEVSIGQWFKDAWTSDSFNNLYDQMQKYNYELHMYDLSTVNAGLKEEAIGKIHNYAKVSADVPRQQIKADVDFYEHIKENGLNTSDRANFFIFQHLKGAHYPYTVNKNIETVNKSTLTDQCYAWLKITKAYLDELKRLGVYDNSTIIITADHGDKKGNMQVIHFVKQKNQHGDKIKKNSAPVSHTEFQNTILFEMGVPKDELPGPTIYDFDEDDERERTMHLNLYRSRFPRVPKYNGAGMGSHNVWACYTYTGDEDDLKKRFKRGPNDYIQMNQCFN